MSGYPVLARSTSSALRCPFGKTILEGRLAENTTKQANIRARLDAIEAEKAQLEGQFSTLRGEGWQINQALIRLADRDLKAKVTFSSVLGRGEKKMGGAPTRPPSPYPFGVGSSSSAGSSDGRFPTRHASVGSNIGHDFETALNGLGHSSTGGIPHPPPPARLGQAPRLRRVRGMENLKAPRPLRDTQATAWWNGVHGWDGVPDLSVQRPGTPFSVDSIAAEVPARPANPVAAELSRDFSSDIEEEEEEEEEEEIGYPLTRCVRSSRGSISEVSVNSSIQEEPSEYLEGGRQYTDSVRPCETIRLKNKARGNGDFARGLGRRGFQAKAKRVGRRAWEKIKEEARDLYFG